MGKYRKSLRLIDRMNDNVERIVIGIMCVIALLVIFAIVLFCISNEQNRIDAGIVVDKDYSAAHTSINYVNGKVQAEYHPDRFQLCIEGEKDGKIVKYWFSVTSGKYELYQIGDNYP